MRRPLIAGNWKMNLLQEEAVWLAEALRDSLEDPGERDVAVFPTFVSVAAVARALASSPIRVGGQDCHHEPSGAFTGEVSPEILRSAGAEMVILGHSERRRLAGLDDQGVRLRLAAALAHGLDPIVCVGESLEERDAGSTMLVVERQVKQALSVVPAPELRRVTLAYEPVWAIGTGRTATPAQAQEVHAAARGWVQELFGDAAADRMRILYGGSVKGSNAGELLAEPDVDGALVGGASLEAAEFVTIVQDQPAPAGG